jgi:hypothetical protein
MRASEERHQGTKSDAAPQKHGEMEFGDSHWLLSPKATNSVAGGNATGSRANDDPTLKGSNMAVNSTLTGSENRWCPKPVALPPATEFVAFGDTGRCEAAQDL